MRTTPSAVLRGDATQGQEAYMTIFCGNKAALSLAENLLFNQLVEGHLPEAPML